ncbi:hypothetical protein AVEN_133831-1, partial [Araneus ventricosus]
LSCSTAHEQRDRSPSLASALQTLQLEQTYVIQNWFFRLWEV